MRWRSKDLLLEFVCVLEMDKFLFYDDIVWCFGLWSKLCVVFMNKYGIVIVGVIEWNLVCRNVLFDCLMVVFRVWNGLSEIWMIFLICCIVVVFWFWMRNMFVVICGFLKLICWSVLRCLVFVCDWGCFIKCKVWSWWVCGLDLSCDYDFC